MAKVIKFSSRTATAALDLLQHRINPVVLKPGDKCPVHNDWHKLLPLTAEQIPHVFAGNQNLGAQLGPRSDHLVDAEFDTPTAVALAPRFMPPTRAIFGRKSKPRSHWLYRCPELHDGHHGAVIKIQNGDGKEVGSLRLGDDGKGAQSMVPPSMHPDGEAVEWSEGCGPEPDEVGTALEQAFRHTCVAALLADIWPPDASNRDSINMAAAGWLARAEVTEDDATNIIEAAAEYAGDEELRKRALTVRDTYRKYEKGDKVVGWRTLTGLIDGKVAKALRTALAAKSRFPDVTQDGAIRPNSPHNIMVAFEMLGIECRYNLFNLGYDINGAPLTEFVGELSDPMLHRLRELVFERFRFSPSVTAVKEAVFMAANHRRHHPVRDYLDGLKWDGVPRLDTWLHVYFKAKDTPYTRAVGRLVLMAAVRRVRKPGCKFDETLVLEDPTQGTDKSSALQILAVRPEWFSDNLSFNLRGREAIEQTTGIWIAEFPELRGLRASDRDKRKAFQSRDTDIGRTAYAHTVTRAKRQYIPIATTNDESYLEDLTGNRRFWPVRTGRIDLEALKRDRDQLWAEAAMCEAEPGASIRLPEQLWLVAAAEQEERLVENPFVAVIDRALREPAEPDGKPMQGKIMVEDVWTLVEVKPERRSAKQHELLNNAMEQLGWARVKHLRVGEGRIKGRRPPHFVRGKQPYERIVVMMDGNYPSRPRALYESDTKGEGKDPIF
jgi:hypothetical protein